MTSMVCPVLISFLTSSTGAAYLEPDFEPATFGPHVPFGPFQTPLNRYPQPVPKPFRPHFMPRASSSPFVSAYSSPSDRSPQPSPAASNFQPPFTPYNHPQQFQYPYASQPPTPGPSYPSTPISGYTTGYTTPIPFTPPRSASVPVPAQMQGNAPPPLFQQPPLTPGQPMYYRPPPASRPSTYNSPPQSPPAGNFVPPSADYFSRGAPQQWTGPPPPAPTSRNYGIPPSAPISRSASSADVRPTPQRAWTEQSHGYRAEPQPVPQPKRRGWFRGV
jgi:hypothetical protein